MKKKLLALVSVACLALGCFGACGSDKKGDDTPASDVTTTVAPSSDERGDGPATSTPEPTATTAPTSTPEPTPTPKPTATPEPTKAPADGPVDLTYDFNDLTYNTSYGTTYEVLEDGSIFLSYSERYQEIKLELPEVLDMSYCTGVTFKVKSEKGNMAFKLYDEGFAEVAVSYDGLTTGIADKTMTPNLNIKVAGIGLMACDNNLTKENYPSADSTVYSVTFHMKAGYNSGTPAPTATPIPVDPNDTGIWENNADISWIDPSKPMIAFTFDDGPVGTASYSTSIRIQDALAASGQHATFFYWGNKINALNQDEIKRAYDMGFEIGNHTYSHPYLTNLTPEKMLEDINKCAEKLSEITGLEHFLIRPPYLSTNSTVKATVREPMINCQIDSKDWNNATTEQILNTIRTQKKDGAIVLMHETYRTTAEAMEILIPELVAEGWQIVSVSELFKAKGLELKDGEVYSFAK